MAERKQGDPRIFVQNGLWGERGKPQPESPNRRQKKPVPGVGFFDGHILETAPLWTADQLQTTVPAQHVTPDIEQTALFSPSLAHPAPEAQAGEEVARVQQDASPEDVPPLVDQPLAQEGQGAEDRSSLHPLEQPAMVIPEHLLAQVTFLPLEQMSEQEQRELVIPTPFFLCTSSYEGQRMYVPGIVLGHNEQTGRAQVMTYSHSVSPDSAIAIQALEEVIPQQLRHEPTPGHIIHPSSRPLTNDPLAGGNEAYRNFLVASTVEGLLTKTIFDQMDGAEQKTGSRHVKKPGQRKAAHTKEAEEGQEGFLVGSAVVQETLPQATDGQEQPDKRTPATEVAIRPLVTVVRSYRMSAKQKAEHSIPTMLCIIATQAERRGGKETRYHAGMITERNPETMKQRTIEWVGERTADLEEAYQALERTVRERHIPLEALQPLELPARPDNAAEAGMLQAQPVEAEPGEDTNPLLTVLTPDEIYIDPNEVTVEEALAQHYPLLRRDVSSFRYWLEFDYDVREDPALHEHLRATHWRWGHYRQQYYNQHPYARLPDGLSFANAGPCSYSDERADRLEARQQKAAEKATYHLETSDSMASVIPFGQPMMPDHYSYRRDLSYRKKIWRHMDKFVEFYKQAEGLGDRAASSRRLHGWKQGVFAMSNRLDRLETELRGLRRRYQEDVRSQEPEATLTYWRRCMTIVATEIVPLRQAIHDAGGLPKDQQEKPLKDLLKPGDCIRIAGRKQYVVRVNKTTITCHDPTVTYFNGQPWESKFKITDFQEVIATAEEREEQKKNR